MSLIELIIEEYGHKEGLTIENDKIIEWPYDAPKPDAIKLNSLKSKTKKSIQRKKLKEKLYRDMSETTVEVNGKIVWADPDSEQNVSGRIREMELNGRSQTKWAQGNDIFILTLDDLKEVYAEGTKKNAALWDDYISALEALKAE